MLSLHTKEKAGGEVFDGPNARLERSILLILSRWQIVLLEISVIEAQQPVEHSKDEPGKKERSEEHCKDVPPLHVDGRVENVFQELAALIVDGAKGDVQSAVLGHDALLILLQILPDTRDMTM